MSLDINQIKTANSLGLDIARGRVQRMSGITKFGYNPAVGSAFETVWELGGIYTPPSTAVTITVNSEAGAADAGVEVTVIGLNGDWELTQETVTLDGSGTVDTDNQYIRLNQAYVSNGTEPTDDILLDYNGSTYLIIESPYNNSLNGFYTVPAGYVAYIENASIALGKDQEVLAKLMTRQENGIYITQGIINSSGAPYQRSWFVPIRVPEKTDIEIRALAQSTTDLSINYEILLEKL